MALNKAEALIHKLFGSSEIQNKIAKSTIKLIVSDIITLYAEFRKAEGLGALFFNMEYPSRSIYLDVQEIYKDITVAEEMMDTKTKDFLQKLLNVIEKNENNTTPVVVMVQDSGLSIHLLDSTEVDETLDKKILDATRNN
jgi:hypothetical protein